MQPHEKGIWSIGLVTGRGPEAAERDASGEEMVTVFVPSQPDRVQRVRAGRAARAVVELPLTVEEAMRLLVSGGVI